MCPSSAFRPAQLYGLLFRKPSLPALPTSAALTCFSPGPLSWPCLTGTTPCSLRLSQAGPLLCPQPQCPGTKGWSQRLSRAPGVKQSCAASPHLHTVLLQLLCALQELGQRLVAVSHQPSAGTWGAPDPLPQCAQGLDQCCLMEIGQARVELQTSDKLH